MRLISLMLMLGLASGGALAQTAAAPQSGQVLASGTVADEATKAAMLARLREVYGADKVVDQIAVGQVSQPANWNNYVQKLITPQLKQVTRGQLKIDGSNVSLRGEVANEAQRQKIASDFATSLNPTYVINNGLRVTASEQGILDATLADRIVEFDSGKATLTATGQAILDQMAGAMQKLAGRKFEIIGHTDNQGLKASNQSLSEARAAAVKTYLIGKGINGDSLGILGQGADRPVASNATPDGRARNRRIEFRIAQ